jgi:hypothetical protein
MRSLTGDQIRGPCPIHDAAGVERVLDRVMHHHRLRAQLVAEPAPLDHADPVLAGERTAELERGTEHLVGCRPDLGRHVGQSPSNTNTGCRLPSPGVRDRGDEHAMPGTGLLDPGDYLGQHGALILPGGEVADIRQGPRDHPVASDRLRTV